MNVTLNTQSEFEQRSHTWNAHTSMSKSNVMYHVLLVLYKLQHKTLQCRFEAHIQLYKPFIRQAKYSTLTM